MISSLIRYCVIGSSKQHNMMYSSILLNYIASEISVTAVGTWLQFTSETPEVFCALRHFNHPSICRIWVFLHVCKCGCAFEWVEVKSSEMPASAHIAVPLVVHNNSIYMMHSETCTLTQTDTLSTFPYPQRHIFVSCHYLFHHVITQEGGQGYTSLNHS